MQDLLDHLEAIGRKGRTVCFVEPKYAGYGPDEQGELARYIHAHFGVEVCHADPAELALDGEEVTYQGRVIDLIYRDYAVEDLLELEDEGVDVRPMRQAFATNRVVSSIAAELDQKSCWEVLGDPVLARRHFSSEDRAFFRRHLPWTRILRPGTTTLPDGDRGDLVEYVLHSREDLVLKPNRSYGGTGVTVGPVTGVTEWKKAVETALAPGGERWVAQRLVPLPVTHFPVKDANGRLHVRAVLRRVRVRPQRVRPRDARARVTGPRRQRRPARRHVRPRGGAPARTDRPLAARAEPGRLGRPSRRDRLESRTWAR